MSALFTQALQLHAPPTLRQVLQGRRPELLSPPRGAQPGGKSGGDLDPGGLDPVDLDPGHLAWLPPPPQQQLLQQLAATRASLAACPPPLAALITACWQPREARRPSAAQVHAALRGMLGAPAPTGGGRRCEEGAGGPGPSIRVGGSAPASL
jgi:hypothetical protein